MPEIYPKPAVEPAPRGLARGGRRTGALARSGPRLMAVLRAQQRVDTDVHAGQPATMSSREIAERTGKKHFNVLIDIRRMLEDLGIAPLSFQAGYLDGNGQQRPMFNLPKDLTLTLVSGCSAVVIQNWTMSKLAGLAVASRFARIYIDAMGPG